MYKFFCPLCLCVVLLCLPSFAEDTYYNGRLINLAPEQFKALETIEQRLYNKIHDDKVTLDRIEQVEMDLYGDIQSGSPIERLNKLKVKSMHQALRGTSIPPSMMKNYQNKYIQNEEYQYHDDVGLIDGFIRLCFPDLYFQLSQ